MATKQNYSWPSSSDVVITGIGNPTGQPVPADAVYIAGEDPSGNLHGIQTDASGNLITTPATGSQTHVIVDSSALPAGASTSALQTTGNTSLSSIVSNQTNGTQITQIAAGTAIIGKIDIDQTTPGTTNGVVVNSSALPTGASTLVAQTTGNTSLNSIDSKTPSLGQALAASSVPVVLTAAQISTLTPLTSVTVTQATGTNLHTVVDSSALPTGAATSANQTNGSQKNQISTPTPLTITQAALTVGTSAIRLTVSGSAPASTRVVLVATPDSASTAKFYIGSSSVTATGATRGIQIVAGQSFIANNDAGDYYIISDTAAQIVEVMEQA